MSIWSPIPESAHTFYEQFKREEPKVKIGNGEQMQHTPFINKHETGQSATNGLMPTVNGYNGSYHSATNGKTVSTSRTELTKMYESFVNFSERLQMLERTVVGLQEEKDALWKVIAQVTSSSEFQRTPLRVDSSVQTDDLFGSEPVGLPNFDDKSSNVLANDFKIASALPIKLETEVRSVATNKNSPPATPKITTALPMQIRPKITESCNSSMSDVSSSKQIENHVSNEKKPYEDNFQPISTPKKRLVKQEKGFTEKPETRKRHGSQKFQASAQINTSDYTDLFLTVHHPDCKKSDLSKFIESRGITREKIRVAQLSAKADRVSFKVSMPTNLSYVISKAPSWDDIVNAKRFYRY